MGYRMMNVSLAVNSNSPQLRVSFTFDWPDGPIVEVKIERPAPGDRPDWDLREVHRMVDNLRYSQAPATSCPECDRHQVMAILRRSIERGHLASDLPAVRVTVRDDHGATRNIPVSPGSD